MATKNDIQEKIAALIEHLPPETQYTLLLKELKEAEAGEKKERVKELMGSICTLLIVSTCTAGVINPTVNKSFDSFFAIDKLLTATSTLSTNFTTTKFDNPPKTTGRYKVDGVHLLLTKTGTKDEFQLEKLRLDLIDPNGNVIDSVSAVSGSWRKQSQFMGAGKSPAGQLYPAESGVYNLATPQWAKKVGSYEGNVNGNPGLGPVIIGMNPTFSTSRSGIAIHLDANNGLNNNPGGSAGTAGCIGIRTINEMQKVIKWLESYPVKQIVVDTVD